MKTLANLFALGVGIGLAIMVGTKISTDALGIIAGVVLGVLASIPTALLIAWAMSRVGRGHEPEGKERGAASYPPVVVVSPGQLQGPQYPALPPMPAARQSPRQFHVVGGDDEGEWD